MRPLRRFLSLDRGARSLLLRAFGLVLLIRLALWILPFRAVHGAVDTRTRGARHGSEPVERITWAVAAASRRIPRASCLTQALAARLLLAANGHDATLRVGVAKNDNGRLRAHAWIESGGRTILGDPRGDVFVALR